MRQLAGVFNTIDMIHTDLCRHIFAQPHSVEQEATSRESLLSSHCISTTYKSDFCSLVLLIIVITLFNSGCGGVRQQAGDCGGGAQVCSCLRLCPHHWRRGPHTR